MAPRTITEVPRPRPRPAGLGGTQVPVEQGQTEAQVVTPSLHNWVEQVYKAFKQTFPTGANELVLLGVREASRTAGADGAAATYDRGTRPVDRGALDPMPGVMADSTTTFNDLLFMVWTPSTPQQATEARVYGCTIDPSSHVTGATGVPYLLEGKAYLTRDGRHKGREDSLHIYSGSYGSILMSREATKTRRVFSVIQSALVGPSNYGPQRWEFVGTEANSTFHIHSSADGYTSDRASRNWSAGCTVLVHHRTSAVYTEFTTLEQGAANASAIPYLVVSSKYVELPDVWATTHANNVERLAEPAYTIRAAGLVRAPAPLTGWLPSTMTYGFARDVLKLAGEIETLSAGVADGSVAGVDEALSNVVFLENERAGILPARLPARLQAWQAARAAGTPLAEEQAALLTDNLSGLGTHLRASIARACFNTVLPYERGPR